jgi:hypothetical protein
LPKPGAAAANSVDSTQHLLYLLPLIPNGTKGIVMYANNIGILSIKLPNLQYKGHRKAKKNPHLPYTTHFIPPLFRLTQNSDISVLNLLILGPSEPLTFNMVVDITN